MIDYKNSLKMEKIEWLDKVKDLSPSPHRDQIIKLLSLLVPQLCEQTFTETYEYICEEWNFVKDSEELKQYNEQKYYTTPKSHSKVKV